MMNERRPYLVTCALLLGSVLLLALAACGTARRSVPVGPPLTLSEAQAERGQHVFMQYCNGCHPGGAAGLGPALNNKPLPGFAIRYQVRHGLGTMPAFSEEVISEEELDALADYLVALRYHGSDASE